MVEQLNGKGRVLAIKFTCEAGKWPLKERASQNFFPRVGLVLRRHRWSKGQQHRSHRRQPGWHGDASGSNALFILLINADIFQKVRLAR